MKVTNAFQWGSFAWNFLGMFSKRPVLFLLWTLADRNQLPHVADGHRTNPRFRQFDKPPSQLTESMESSLNVFNTSGGVRTRNPFSFNSIEINVIIREKKMNHRQRKQKRSVKNRKSFFCLFESGQNEKRNKLRKPEQVHMCRVLPNDPIPDWVAPLLNPAWRPICPSRSARVCSSLNSRLFSSAIFGPKRGPQYSGCFWVCGIVNTCLVFRSDNVMANWKLTILLRAKRHSVTWGILRRSYRSAVWKISSSGTPYFLTAAWNLHSQTKKIISIPQKNHPLRNASGRINIPVPKSAPRSFQKQFSLLFLATNFDTTSWRQKGLDHVTSRQLIRPIPEELFSFFWKNDLNDCSSV